MRTRIAIGSGLAALALPMATPGLVSAVSASATSGNFKTPSGNIVCDYDFTKYAQQSLHPYVRCGIKTGLKPPPPRNAPGCRELDYQGNRVALGATGRARAISCEGDAGPFAGEAHAWVLRYGKTWSGGGLRCVSAVKGLTCRNKRGHGFFLSRARWRPF